MSATIITHSLVIGAIVATLATIIEWAKHKPVKKATYASAYVDKNTIRITESHDRFVNHEITKTPINR